MLTRIYILKNAPTYAVQKKTYRRPTPETTLRKVGKNAYNHSQYLENLCSLHFINVLLFVNHPFWSY